MGGVEELATYEAKTAKSMKENVISLWEHLFLF